MKRLWVTFLILLLHLALSKSQEPDPKYCNSFDNECDACTSAGSVWCAAEFKCVTSASLCDSIKDIYWLDGSDVPTCDSTDWIITNSANCPRHHLELAKDQKSISFTGNFLDGPLQPRFLVCDYEDPYVSIPKSSIQYGAFMRVNVTNTKDQPRFFIISDGWDSFKKASAAPADFIEDWGLDESYRYNSGDKTIETLSLAVVAPPGKYPLVMALRYQDTNTSTNRCIFTREIEYTQQARYYTLYNFLEAGGPLFVVGLFMVINQMVFFEGRFSDDLRQLKQEEMVIKSKKGVTYNKDNYLKRWWRQLKNIFSTLFVISDKEIIRRKGTDVYYFLYFQKLIILFTLCCCVITLPVLLPIDMGSDHYDFYEDWAGFTIASLPIDSSLNYVHIAIMTLYMVIGAVFLWRVRMLSRVVVVSEFDEKFPTAARLCSVKIENIPVTITDDNMLRTYFTELYGADNVVSCTIAPNLSTLQKLRLKKESAETALADYIILLEKTGKRPIRRDWDFLWWKNKRPFLVKVDAIDYTKSRIETLKKQIEEYCDKFDSAKMQGTGVAFVCFTTTELAQKCVRDHKRKWRLPFIYNSAKPTSVSAKLNSYSWWVTIAPDPDLIKWENLHETYSTRVRNKIIANLLMLGVLCFLYVFAFANSFSSFVRDNSKSKIWWVYKNDATRKQAVNWAFKVFPQIIALINELWPRTIKRTIAAEKNHSTLEERVSRMEKVIFWMVINSLVISRIFWFGVGMMVLFYANAPFDSYHYLFVSTGLNMAKSIFVQCFTGQGTSWITGTILRVLKYYKRGKMPRPGYGYEGGYAKKLMIMLNLLVWGGLQPLMWPIGVFYFSWMYLVDKMIILNLAKRQPVSDGAMLKVVARNLQYYIALFPLFVLTILMRHMIDNPISALILLLPFGAVVLLIFNFGNIERYYQAPIIVAVTPDDQDKKFGLDVSAILSGFNQDADNVGPDVEDAAPVQPEPNSDELASTSDNNIELQPVINNVTTNVDNLGKDIQKGVNKAADFVSNKMSRMSDAGNCLEVFKKEIVGPLWHKLDVGHPYKDKIDPDILKECYQHPALLTLQLKGKDDIVQEMDSSFNNMLATEDQVNAALRRRPAPTTKKEEKEKEKKPEAVDFSLVTISEDNEGTSL